LQSWFVCVTPSTYVSSSCWILFFVF
jgi:hypothetical protein